MSKRAPGMTRTGGIGLFVFLAINAVIHLLGGSKEGLWMLIGIPIFIACILGTRQD